MIAAAEPDSDLVKIFTLALPLLTLLATAYIGYKQAQLTTHVNGHMSEMLKVTAEAALARGIVAGGEQKKEEIRIDALTKKADAAVAVATSTKT